MAQIHFISYSALKVGVDDSLSSVVLSSTIFWTRPPGLSHTFASVSGRRNKGWGKAHPLSRVAQK